MPKRFVVLCSLLVLFSTLPGFAAEGDIPRTKSGRPDLSGNYDLASLTPWERDPKFGERQFLTREEAAEMEKAAAMASAAANSASDPNRGAPPAGGDGSAGAAGDVGGYNFFWLDIGTQGFAVDGRVQTSIITDPPDGRLPPLTEAGKARRANINPYAYKNTGDAWWLATGDDPYDGPETVSLLDRCLYVGVATVPPRPVPYNNLKTIVQTEDHVMILVEWMHWARVIRLGSEDRPAAHLPAEIRSLGGDSIGWWEGDTLVVDTTNFLDMPRTPREGLHVVERFTREADSVLYEFTVEDSDYEAPYSGQFPWPQTDDLLFEYACHEGNYSLGNILRGARILERETLAKSSSSGAE